MHDATIDIERNAGATDAPATEWADVRKAVRCASEEDAAGLVSELLQEARAALSHEQSELVLLLRSKDNLAVITFNLMGLITSVCKNSSDLLGQPVEGLIGQPIDSILQQRSRGVKQTAAEMKNADQGNIVHSVRNHLREDGTEFEAEHTLVAVVGKGEHVMGFVREVREVTDHQVRESRIAELDGVIAFLLKEQAGQRSGA